MGDGSYCVHRASTLEVAPRERAEFWTEHVQGYHCLLDLRFRDGRDLTAAPSASSVNVGVQEILDRLAPDDA